MFSLSVYWKRMFESNVQIQIVKKKKKEEEEIITVFDGFICLFGIEATDWVMY